VTRETFGNFIGGAWTGSASGRTFGDENPARRGSVLAQFAASGAADAADAVSAAERTCRSWGGAPLADRQRVVVRFLQLLEESREEISRIVTLENGKTIRESRAEVDSALIEGRHHVNQSTAFYGGAGTGSGGEITSWVQYEPVGVVGVISPWNFPLNVMCRKTLPALLTGNTVVFKPASFTPWSGVYLARLFERSGVPAGVFNCVTGPGSDVGDALVSDPRVRAISFTGSTAVGRVIQMKAAANLTRTQLELGGKNALIVMPDADMSRAVEAAMTAGFSNAGQWCTSTSRVLLHRTIADRFLADLLGRCRGMQVGDGLEDRTDMGPVAGQRQYESVRAAIRTAQVEGARMAAGAEGADSEAGYFIRPTVFVDVRPEMAIFRDEVFGPVLAVCEFDSLDEALDTANNSTYGLSSSIFTSDLRTARTYIQAIQAGVAHVNVHTGYKEPSMPFGGIKQSGAGLPENGETGLQFFIDRKAVYLRG
jgi:aldehyde dehydrogenase (NAD+)